MLDRRMHIGRRVRVFVVLTMLRGPPQDAALGRSLCEESQAELKDARGAKGAMGEVAMIACADGEDPNQIQHHRQHDGAPCQPSPEDGEAPDMDQHETDAGGVGDVV